MPLSGSNHNSLLDLKRMKVPQFKALLEERGFRVGGTKVELTERRMNLVGDCFEDV